MGSVKPVLVQVRASASIVKKMENLIVRPVRTITNGHILLLNYENFLFLKHKERRGSKNDIKSMKEIFTKFGFRVSTGEDLTAKETDKIIKEYLREVLWDKCDMIIVVIMSHGWYGDNFICYDSEMRSLRDLLKYVSKL